MALSSQVLSTNVQLLKSKVTRYAVFGTIIAAIAMIIATLSVSYFQTGDISLNGIFEAQKSNVALWLMDGMPFVFALWGQHVSSMMAYEAGIMVMEQTDGLLTQTKVLEQKAMHDATHDALTDLPNRILLHDRLEQALLHAHHENNMLAIFIVSMDRFNEINDTLGHHSGDRLLKKVTARLIGGIEEEETLARFGSDEFAIVMPKIASREDVQSKVTKIKKTLEEPCILDGLLLDVQVSIGAAIYPEHGKDADTLFQHADVAMYVAKETNQGFVLYSSELDRHSPLRLTLMGELRYAIEHDELQLRYQPKLNNHTNKISQVEVLVRWQHSQHGLISPDDFIPLAERTGLIKPLSRWVLKYAFQQCSQWLKSGLDITIAVNLSAPTLLDPELPDMIGGLLVSHDVPSENLILEITETAIMTDQDLAFEVISRIADKGIRFSIDDFGTGYSSLSYLRKLPVKELKIDQSFVMGMLENENDAVIVRATINLAHDLDLKVVAEGVESKGILEKLKSLGCDELQGYYISKPITADEVLNFF